ARRGAVACPDRLIDVGVMGNRALELLGRPDASLAHQPRNERRRPGKPPACHAGDGIAPVLILILEDPGAARRDGPVSTDRGGRSRGFWSADAARPAAAPTRTVAAAAGHPTATACAADASPSRRRRVVVLVELDDRKPEEAPLLHGEFDNALAGVGDGQRAAHAGPWRHAPGGTGHARGRGRNVEDVR